MTRKTAGEVEIEIDGKLYAGNWKRVGDSIAVHYLGTRPETTELGKWAARRSCEDIAKRNGAEIFGET